LVFAGRDTALWTAAKDVTGLFRMGPRDSASVATNFAITNLAQDSAGAIYTVRNERIFKLQRGGFIPLPISNPFLAFTLVDIAVHPNGTVWLLDEDAGLVRMTDGRLTRVAPLQERVARRSSLYIDRKGRIWVAQLNRVALYDREQLTFFGADEGIPQGLIYQVTEDRAGNVWAAGDGGISRFEDGRFRTIAEGRDLPGGTVYGISEDELGAWWVVTRTSVLRIPPGETDRALVDSTYVLPFRTFDGRDGLRGMVTAGSWGVPVTRTADGRIWVATDGGVASVDPSRLPPEPAPPVLIEAARIDGREISLTEAAPISAARGDLEIDYTATSLAMPERVQFRYRLEGADRAWQDAGTRRQASYSRLAPGEYRFRVAARNGDGLWGDATLAWTFRILPPWYQTVWFRVAVVMLVGALGAAATTMVYRRRHAREREALKQQYEATLAERGRIAQDLHDSLLQGFVGVTLQLKAAENALPENSDLARETIRRVQRLARESLREARERVWDLHHLDKATGDLPTALAAVARERASGTGIEISLGIIGERRPLDGRLEDALFRMGREAIANAIRHADPRQIDITVQYAETSVGVEVRDDGRGLSPDEADEAHRQGHFGLSGIRERAVRMGGRCEVRPRPEGGTVVALELPATDPPNSVSHRV
jgi:signal transduction histidine kinase